MLNDNQLVNEKVCLDRGGRCWSKVQEAKVAGAGNLSCMGV